MSVLLIVRKFWKYKFCTLPIAALVLVGGFYVVAVKPSTYEAGATYILVNPPPAPTDAQIARDPALGRINSDNPYLRFSDQTVLVQVLASRLNSEEGRRSLAKQGADPTYLVTPSPEFGFSAPILQVTGTGASAAAAVRSAELVGQAAKQELDRMQAVRGVDKTYRIRTETVVAPHDAMLKASGKLRALVGVIALGTILMFISISVLDALSALRADWARSRPVDYEGPPEDYAGRPEDGDPSGEGPFVSPLILAEDSDPGSDPDQEAQPWPVEARQR